MEVRERLLNIVSSNSLEDFLAFTKENRNSLLTIMEGYTKKQLDKLWEDVQQTFAPFLLSLGDTGEDENEEMKRVQSVLESVILLAKSTIGQPEPHMSPCLLSVAFVLHGLLLEIPDKAEALRNSITTLFEDWWKRELQGRETLAVNTLSVLIQKSLQAKGTTGVKRVWSLHSALEHIDLKNENSLPVCDLLKHCIVNVNYLCSEEGCRFLGYILTLDVDLMISLHKTIKIHIPAAPKLCLEKYGEIYFRAWQKASDDVREKLEISCIQDLMYHAAHAQKTLAVKLRKILSYLHRQKSVRGVNKMLLTLYEPFLWRSLNVANAQVRGNAAVLLMDAFPLENPDNNLEENDQLRQKQFNILDSLLDDPVPAVRSLAVPGHFRILSLYWEVIPVAKVKSILTKMITDMVNDTSSSNVREAVIRGMIILLDNPLSHPMLKPVLPTLRNNIHDHSEKVRVAMVDLLLKVQKVRTIKAWDIVPVEHLLVRLSMDRPAIVRRIIKLTLRSFLPLDKSCDVHMQRCTAMIHTNPAAARVFFSNLHNHVSVQETATLMINICHTILKLIKAKRNDTTNNESRSGTRVDDETEDMDELSLTNIPIMRGFIEGIHIMWKSIEADLEETSHKDLLQELYQKFSLSVPEMLKCFEDSQICMALVMLSGNLPPKSIPTISRSLVSKLKNMPDDSTMEDFYPGVEALCRWKKLPDLCELIEEWMSETLDTTTSTTTMIKSKKSSRKSVKFVNPSASKPRLGVLYTTCLVCNTLCRTALISHPDQLDNLLQLYGNVLDCIECTLDNGNEKYKPDDNLLTDCFMVYCKLLLMCHEKDKEDSGLLSGLDVILSWSQDKLLPHLCPQTEEAVVSSKKRNHEESLHNGTLLAKDILKMVFSTCYSVLLIGAGSVEFTTRLADFCTAYLKTDFSLGLLPQVMKCLHQITAFTVITQMESENDVTDRKKIVPECLGHMLVAMASYCKEKKELAGMALLSTKVIFSDIIFEVYQSSDPELQQDTMATIVAGVVAELANVSSQLDLDNYDGGLSSLPVLTAWLCEAMAKRASIFKHFIRELGECVQSGAVLDIHRIHAAIHLVGGIGKWRVKSTGLKDICNIVQQQVDNGDFVKDEENSTDRETLTLVKDKLRSVQELLDMAR